MAEGTTDQNGAFRLQGQKTEITTIDPKLNICKSILFQIENRKINVQITNATTME